MNHTKRLLKIAEKILADVHFSTQQEFDEYLKNHPNYRENTKFYVNGVQVKAPPREKNNDGDMTDEQKIIDSMTDEQKELHQMAISYDFYGQKHAAFSKKSHQYTLEKLSGNESNKIRSFVALNENTPHKTLEKLSGDESETVRSFVAWNENTPHKILEKLSGDESEKVRLRVATNTNTPHKILEKLSGDESNEVRLRVAMNTNTPSEILEKLSDDKDRSVRSKVAMNPNTPSEILKKLSRDNYSEVICGVAKNPNAESEILDYIYDYGDYDVPEIPHERFWVIVHPNVGEETLKKALNNGGYYAEIAKMRLNGEKIPLSTDYSSPETNYDFTICYSEYFEAKNGRYLQDYDDDDYDYEDDEIDDDYLTDDYRKEYYDNIYWK